MKFKPCFRQIVVVLEERKKNEVKSSLRIFVPEQKEEYVVCYVKDWADDCVLQFNLDSRVIVDAHMVRTVEIDGLKTFFVPETAIVLLEK